MLELFRLEAESQAEILSSGVLAIEEQRQSAETIESLMRAAHSLKGAARIVGLDAAVQVAHALEDVFLAAGDNKISVQPTHADILLTGIDFLSSIAAADNGTDTTWQDKANTCVRDLQALTSSAPQQASDSTPESAGPPTTDGTHTTQPAIPDSSITTEPNQQETETAGKEKPQHDALQNTTETKSGATAENAPTGTGPTDAPLPQKKPAHMIPASHKQILPIQQTMRRIELFESPQEA